MNRDNYFLGALLGFIVPLFGILLLYMIRFMSRNVSLNGFIYLIQTNHSIIPKIISLGLIATIPLITYYKNRRRYTTLKGVFTLIILYALLAVLYKFNFL
ncbi:MAG: hypothetical protein JNJ58_05975 [Chitinophagaceae bacterium]|nr:hypothetical protein [Chitinophagaceae bacterium]